MSARGNAAVKPIGVDPEKLEAIKQVEKEQTPSNKIVLDKKDNAGKADGGKKKKGGFC